MSEERAETRTAEIRQRVKRFRDNERAEAIGGFYDDRASMEFRARFMADFMFLLSRADDLEREVAAERTRQEELEGVLGFYANESNYLFAGEEIRRDDGERARKALEIRREDG